MWEAIPGMVLDFTTSKRSNGEVWDFGNKEDFDRAMKWVKRKEGLIIVGGPLQGIRSKATHTEMQQQINKHVEGWGRICKVQEQNAMYHASV